MTEKIIIYGIPTCGTVKKARKFLDDRGLAYQWVDFRETPPSSEQVHQWVTNLGAKAMRNTSGGAYRALGEEKKSWNDTQWNAAYASEPMLIKRPILEIAGEAKAVGFKEAVYEELLKQNEA